MSWIALMVMAVVTVSLLYPRVIGNRIGLTLMLPVIGYTAWHYVDWQFRSIEYLAAAVLGGLLAGIAALVLGLPVSSPRPRQFISHRLRGLGVLIKHPDYRNALVQQLGITLYEELIWRVFLTAALLPLLPAWSVVVLSAVLFWLVHEDNRPVGWHSVEFFLFALLLGAVYLVAGSVLLIWMMHLARNVLILSAACWEEQNVGHSVAVKDSTS